MLLCLVFFLLSVNYADCHEQVLCVEYHYDECCGTLGFVLLEKNYILNFNKCYIFLILFRASAYSSWVHREGVEFGIKLALWIGLH